MEKHTNENICEVFGDILKLCEENDVEFLNAYWEAVDTSKEYETVNVLLFRIFNIDFDVDWFRRVLQHKFDDTEFAYHECLQTGDILIITSSI